MNFITFNSIYSSPFPPTLGIYDQPISLLNTLKPEEKGGKIQATQEEVKLVGTYQLLLHSSYVEYVGRTHTNT